MAEKKEYYIKINQKRITVSKTIFKASEQHRRKDRTITEAKEKHGVLSIDAFGDEKQPSTKTLCNSSERSVEEQVLDHLDIEKLYLGLEILSENEREIIQAIFFEGKSERTFSKESGIPQSTINYRKKKALGRLKKFLEK